MEKKTIIVNEMKTTKKEISYELNKATELLKKRRYKKMSRARIVNQENIERMNNSCPTCFRKFEMGELVIYNKYSHNYLCLNCSLQIGLITTDEAYETVNYFKNKGYRLIKCLIVEGDE